MPASSYKRPDDARSLALFEYGLNHVAARFDPDVSLVRSDWNSSVHDPRDSLWYALALLMSDPDEGSRRAEDLIRQVLTMQDRSGGAHSGNFRWLFENNVVDDLNAVEFVLEGLINILLRAADRLSAETRTAVFEAMRLGFEEIERLDVHWTYTNIHLLEIENCLLGGQLLGDDRLVARGKRRLREWAAHTRADGAPNEFNSPTYSAVQTLALAAIAQWVRDKEARDLALEMEAFLWRHVAGHWHAPTAQLAGPYSRAYRRDVTGSVAYLRVLLYKLLGDERLLAPTEYYSGPGREGDILISLSELHCPGDALQMFHETEEREVRETPSRAQDQHTVTYLRPEFALGTMAREYGVGDPPERWPQHNPCTVHYVRSGSPGYGVLYVRYLLNDRKIGEFAYPSSGAAVDLWDEGIFRTAQNGSSAIVAYGMLPRGPRPISSLRLDVRLLGPGESDVWTPDGPWDGEAQTLQPLEPLVVADGEAYIGILPLEPERLSPDAPVLLHKDGQEIVLSIYNYRGPPKSFWEYRSLTGPFWKGNVRNGFVLSVIPRSECASLAQFADRLRATEIADALDGSLRGITFGSGEAAVKLQYDLRDLHL